MGTHCLRKEKYMTKNIYYLKLKGNRINLTDNGIDINDALSLTFVNNNYNFDRLLSIFSELNGIEIFGCIVQDNGDETDEFVSAYFENYTILSSLEYNLENDTYTVKLTAPNEVEQRLAELERRIASLEG